MPYSLKSPPPWAKNKSDAVIRVSAEVFNQTLRETGSEEKARIASLAAMANAEKEFKARAAGKSNPVKKSANDLVAELIKQKYNLE
jgi:hypothetical protein